MVDKPMAFTAAECNRLEAALTSGGGQFTFVHRLFSPAIQRLRTLLDEGRFGVPWAVHVSWLAAGGLGGVSVEDDALVADPRWSGGGELANFLGYPVGTLRYLVGLEVETVYARMATHTHAPHRAHGVEDFGVVLLGLQRDVSATITVGRLAAGSNILSVRIHGSHASAMVDEDRPRLLVNGVRALERSADSSGTLALHGLLDDFVAAIDGRHPPLCGVQDGRALAAVLRAAYASAASGTVARLNEAPEEDTLP
jgi:predicted dehydrogenase